MLPLPPVCTSSRIDPRFALNVTLFHVNPSSYPISPANMNLADARGDMAFSLRDVMLPLECAGRQTGVASFDCGN
eukprot:COSAG02_NODE_20553_length_826_cov_0.784044_1_plen_74_part_10